MSESLEQQEYSLQLQPPAVLTVHNANRTRSFVIDVFEAWRVLTNNSKQPTEDARWIANRQYIANKFACSIDDISENMAREFNEVIIAIGTKVENDIAKKLDGMLS